MRIATASFAIIMATACVTTGTADTVNIGVGNTYYDPMYPVVQPGDTIHWFREGGTHDVTSGVPCSDEDGVFYAPITGGNPTFDWTVPVDATGAIVYYCGVGGHCVNGDQFGALLINTGAVHVVETNGFSFDPAHIEVNAGDVVVWHNTGGTHDVVFGANCVDSGEFNEPLTPLFPQVVYIVPADHPGGVIDYFCEPHCTWGMTGTITVAGSGNDCPADVDGNGTVNVDDLLAVISTFGQDCDCPEDITDDGVVDVNDILELLGAFGMDC